MGRIITIARGMGSGGKTIGKMLAKELDIPVLAKLPIKSEIASLVDKGAVELAEIKELYDAADKIKEMLK